MKECSDVRNASRRFATVRVSDYCLIIPCCVHMVRYSTWTDLGRRQSMASQAPFLWRVANWHCGLLCFLIIDLMKVRSVCAGARECVCASVGLFITLSFVLAWMGMWCVFMQILLTQLFRWLVSVACIPRLREYTFRSHGATRFAAGQAPKRGLWLGLGWAMHLGEVVGVVPQHPIVPCILSTASKDDWCACGLQHWQDDLYCSLIDSHLTPFWPVSRWGYL